MSEPARREPERADESARLPMDSDVDVADDSKPFQHVRPTPLLRLRALVLAAVFVGGCVGGIARYGVTLGWPTPRYGFPWAIFAVNTSGAFALALLVVLVMEVVPPTRYLRPALGTGFLGAWTTFSGVTVTGSELIADHRAATGLLYLFGSILGGLGAASSGLLTGRAIAAAGQHRRQSERRPGGT